MILTMGEDESTPLQDDVKQLLGEFEQLLQATVRDHALAALAVAAAAGLIAGLMLTRRR